MRRMLNWYFCLRDTLFDEDAAVFVAKLFVLVPGTAQPLFIPRMHFA